MHSKLLATILILSSFSTLANAENRSYIDRRYITSAAGFQSPNLEESDFNIVIAGLDELGSIVARSSNAATQQEIQSMRYDIATNIGKDLWIFDIFVKTRPTRKSGGIEFSIQDLNAFVQSLKTQTCRAARSEYIAIRNELVKNRGDITPNNFAQGLVDARLEYGKRCQLNVNAADLALIPLPR